ncbi:hypothetical protein E8E15_008377 [Penicillium rubens]|uniref:Uncharacterized protein n=1 Tax=Penicillium chrysogenum TaxID=5076 RepID=A0A167SAC4_PENCH|nr:uncharacterized protein N7525_009160 [Penicillium rubens]KZN86954.1 hypothetical protein EN45_055080 [Penicillium chrysogenum]KAF3023955.1 hypothetical protein E8E15_008377 [Penicillium rubens]KAJ5053688.1 hypothetical protein NUH16_010761 [Penicillium rubens]KAJ5830907.1 hypothetical protein N7525_009160 [Penicillium rubens]KAJ5854456.1 hypothetical protein N7534_006999 [Penicillium rubens]
MPDKTKTESEAPMVSHGRGGKPALTPSLHNQHLTSNTSKKPGQGNIGHDTTEYVDGEIVREGPYGDQGDGAYSAGVSTSTTPTKPKPKPKSPHDCKPDATPTDASSTQRGGAGNIGSPMVRPSSRVPHDTDMIPELAVRDSTDETYHTGRGGQGNVHLDETALKEKEEKEKKKKVAHEGLADKLKYKLLGRK